MKNKAKIILSLLLSAVVLQSFSACSANDTDTKNTDDTAAAVSSDSISDTETNSSETSQPAQSTAPTDDKESGSIPELSDPTPDSEGEMINGLLVYNGTAYELFGGGESLAKDYAKAISDIKNYLGKDIKVYNVIVPTHCGVTLPEKFSDKVSSQKDYLNTVCSSYSADVIGVNTFDTIMHHRDEYLYFNTDHHWTGRAAYYAYQDFCRSAGVDYLSLNDMQSNKISGYYGSLSNDIDDSLLKEDYVEYFTIKDEIDTTLYDSDGENPQDYMLIHSYAEGSNAYGVFLGGDTPLLVTKNNNGNGKKIAVVKESYGNAFAPFIAYTYSEAHIMDFRDIDFDLKKYLTDNGIDEIIFINNSMASATPERVEELEALTDGSADSGSDLTDDDTQSVDDADDDNNDDEDTEEYIDDEDDENDDDEYIDDEYDEDDTDDE